VVTSYEGDCPKRYNGWTDPANQTFPFTVPADLPAGDAIFAWSWDNREQEFFMNCAAVTITNANSDDPSSTPSGTSPSASGSATNVAISPSSTAAAQTFALGACSCSCGSAGPSGTEYLLSDCACTCPTAPAPAAKLRPRWLGPRKPASTKGPFALAGASHSCTCGARSAAAPQAPVSYSGCACRASAAAAAKRQSAVAFADRPLIFVADIDNGCETPHTTAELQYPDPGPDVVMGDGAYPLELPSGNCGS